MTVQNGGSSGRGSRRSRSAVCALVVAATLVGTAATAQAAPGRDLDVLVRTAPAHVSTAGVQRAVPTLDVRRVRSLGAHAAVVTVRSAASFTAVRAALDAAPRISGAALDRRMSAAGTPAPVASGARLAAQQWDLWDARSIRRAGGYGIDAARAWTRTLGSPDVVVAVLDTGITAHPALVGATIARGYDFVSGTDGTDSGDGDGWDADPTDPGDACGDTGESSSWHGSFVTSEIVARHGGSVAGAAPGVTVLPVRVLGTCGGAESDTIAAITWASGGEVPGVAPALRRADVLSMSLGSAEGGCPAALQTAIDGAVARGTTVIAAAGNDGGDVADASPANCDGVVSVAATTRSGVPAGYSNLGLTDVAPVIAAPGGSTADPVLGAGWTSSTDMDADGNRATVVRSMGTSMAAPRVAAAAALLLSVHPRLTPAQVVARLVATATRFPVSSGCTAGTCGPGIVNAGAAVGAAARFVHADAVVVTGSPRVGRVLTAHAGRWRPTPATVRYRWSRDGVAIAGATGRTYVLRARDLHHRISVRVTVARPGAVPAAAASGARTVRPA